MLLELAEFSHLFKSIEIAAHALLLFILLHIYIITMTEKKDDKKPATDISKKPKASQTDKYYKIKADFSYLSAYNYKITKEIGRGGYGVVYKVASF